MQDTMKQEKFVRPDKDIAADLAEKFEQAHAEDPLRFKALPGVTTNWNPTKMVMLYEFAADPAAVQQDFADSISIDRSGVSRKVHSMDWPEFEETLKKLIEMSPEDAIKFEAKAFEEKAVLKAAVKSRTKLISKEAFYSNLTKSLVAAQSVKVKPFAPAIIVKNPKNKRTDEHLVLLLSDMHVGQEFYLEETGGINEYNLDIFHKRAENLQKALIEILEIHSEAYKIPELHILALGDMVQGGNANGEWGPSSNSHMDVCTCAVTAAKTISNMIESWKVYFDKVTFTGVIGNHGRGGATKNSDPIGANWDNVCYANLAAYYKDDKKVDVDFSKTWWHQKNILGTEFLMVHGDYCSSSINSLLTLDQKIRGITTKVPGLAPFNVLCVGHFHSHTQIETPMGRIMVNGSFPGADMHSMHHMRTGSRPAQTVFGVHPRRGITWQYWLDLESERE